MPRQAELFLSEMPDSSSCLEISGCYTGPLEDKCIVHNACLSHILYKMLTGKVKSGVAQKR